MDMFFSLFKGKELDSEVGNNKKILFLFSIKSQKKMIKNFYFRFEISSKYFSTWWNNWWRWYASKFLGTWSNTRSFPQKQRLRGLERKKRRKNRNQKKKDNQLFFFFVYIECFVGEKIWMYDFTFSYFTRNRVLF